MSENAAHKCNTCDMHANECNKVFIIHYHNSIVSLLTRSTELTRRLNAITQQYCVILHGTGMGKYCSRNINWIIN